MSADSVRNAYPLFQEEGGGVTPISALQLNIGIINYKLAENLNKCWHSRMPYIGSATMCNPCFAAEYEGIIYAVAMWSLPIAANRLTDGFHCLELRRMAISDDSPKNTASRMLRIMRLVIVKKRPDIKKLVSYQDTGVHEGTIYKAAGWTKGPECKYVNWSTHSKRPGSIEQSKYPKIRWEYYL